jgi:hypothetical protein
MFGECGLGLGRLFKLAKLPLFIKFRPSNSGYYIASVPMKRLIKLSGYRKKRWVFEDGWLVLEAF